MGRKCKQIKPSLEYCSFGIWLATHMSQSNILLIDLHNEIGIAYSVVYSWLRGDSIPRLNHLIEVCEVISKYNGQSPLDLMSAALSNFDEMIGAVRRYHKRHPSVKDDKGHEEMLDAFNLIHCDRIWPHDEED
jgi:predicted transcriptional regulator